MGKRSREEAGNPGEPPASSTKRARHGFRVGPENLPDGPWRRKVDKIKKELISKAKVKKQYAKVKAQLRDETMRNQGPISDQPRQGTSDDDPDGNNGLSDKIEEDDGESGDPEAPQIHPERQAMLDLDEHRQQRVEQHRRQRQLQPWRQEEDLPQAAAADTTKDVDGAEMKGDGTTDNVEGSENHHVERENSCPGTRREHTKPRLPRSIAKAEREGERRRSEAAARAAERARQEKERNKKIADRERYRRAMAKAHRPGPDGRPKIGRESRLLLERVQRLTGKK